MFTPTRRRLLVTVAVIAVLTFAMPAAAQLSANMRDILRRIHTTQEFGTGGRGAGAGGRWVDGGAGYTALERTAEGALEIVRYDTAAGQRDVLMNVVQLTPAAVGTPLQFSDYAMSADGRRIAYYQFDQAGVPEFTLINYTDTLYPAVTRDPYPKAGQTNASVRIGVVAAIGGATQWMKIPGDPRNTYVARMDWAAGRPSVSRRRRRAARIRTTCRPTAGGRSTAIRVSTCPANWT